MPLCHSLFRQWFFPLFPFGLSWCVYRQCQILSKPTEKKTKYIVHVSTDLPWWLGLKISFKVDRSFSKSESDGSCYIICNMISRFTCMKMYHRVSCKCTWTYNSNNIRWHICYVRVPDKSDSCRMMNNTNLLL